MTKQFTLLISFLVLFCNLTAQPGALDASFGTGGKRTASFGTGWIDNAEDLAIQTDGKIVAAGVSQDPITELDKVSLMRYNSNGSADNTFAVNGMLTASVVSGFHCGASAVALQTDGKIVIAGQANDTSNAAPQPGYLFVMRFNANGTPDNLFANNGLALMQMTMAVSPDVQASDLLIQPDGKIVLSGAADTSGNGEMVFLRFNSNGSPDVSFGTSGMLMLGLPSGLPAPMSIALQADGKIVFAGIIDNQTYNNALLGRINTGGTIDNTFGASGYVFPTYGFSSGFFGLALQSDGKLVASGFDTNGALLARFNTNGTPDAAFANNGSLIMLIGTQNDARFNDVVIQPDGKIVAAGGADTAFAMIRTSALGALEAGFGFGGIVQTDFPQTFLSEANAVKLQTDGKIVLAGFGLSLNINAPSIYALSRYHGDQATLLSDNANNMFANFYPNPAAQTIHIHSSEPMKVFLYDVAGKKILDFDISEGENEMDISAQPPGIYCLEFISSSGRKVKKLVIE